jgi:hypothetical protein
MILIDDNDKTSNATRKNKGKQKAIDSDCVEIKTKNPYKPIRKIQRF